MTYITRLTLTAFRNYDHLRLDIGPHPIVLTGPNGAGKTNLLEAVSLLGPGRGLRGAKLAEIGKLMPLPHGRGRETYGAAVSRTGEGVSQPQSLPQPTPSPVGLSPADLSHEGEIKERWAVAATIATQAGTRSVGTGQEDSPDRRVVRIDGANRAQGALAEVAALLWVTPAMDRLFTEPSSARRKFLDRIVYGYDPAHATRVGRYEQALRERQKLLEQQRHPAWLEGIEAVMAETGVAVAASRLATTTRLHHACAATRDPAFPQPAVAVTGEVETYLADRSALETEDWLRAALAQNRNSDAASSRCATGVHRSDLTVRYRDKDMPAALCSTGEQKALLIALVLANAELMLQQRGDKPILLLDEITAHLDESRRAALFERIRALGLQAWMSGTEAGVFEALKGSAAYFNIENGAVRAA